MRQSTWDQTWAGARRGAWGAPAQLRVGDAERETAVAALGEHYTAGRLTLEEYDQRTSQAFRARTAADLWPLFGDLPQLPPPHQPEDERSGFSFAPVLLVVIALVVLTQLPWPLVLVVGLFWWGRTYRRWTRGQAAHAGRTAHTRGNRRAVRGTCS